MTGDAGGARVIAWAAFASRVTWVPPLRYTPVAVAGRDDEPADDAGDRECDDEHEQHDAHPFTSSGTRSSGRVTCTRGPMSSAKARVPTPTSPPSSQPTASTVTSMAVRTIQILTPQR